MGGLKEELLKSIWHAFTALDLDRSGKVSKSQLKVLSHNLCTVLNVPHDPVALEEHFRDDDEGPVSNQGYMPYLNKFILEKFVYVVLKIRDILQTEGYLCGLVVASHLSEMTSRQAKRQHAVGRVTESWHVSFVRNKQTKKANKNPLLSSFFPGIVCSSR